VAPVSSIAIEAVFVVLPAASFAIAWNDRAPVPTEIDHVWRAPFFVHVTPGVDESQAIRRFVYSHPRTTLASDVSSVASTTTSIVVEPASFAPACGETIVTFGGAVSAPGAGVGVGAGAVPRFAPTTSSSC
jgi:hypothetical protein